jgi:hypothetical protein
VKSCVCVVGWHFPQSFFEFLTQIPDIDIYVICHRPHYQIPDVIQKMISPDILILTKNIGYDWGGYQQFLHLGIYKNYEICFFCHDDIKIKNPGLFEFCTDQLTYHPDSTKILGNGRQTHKRDWPKTHIQSYAHSRWKPPSWDYLHDTVRGSFWVSSREVLQQILPLEVYWDHLKVLGVGSGNWSLRATCGKAQAILGDNAFSYLSETYMTSDFIDEYARGSPESYKKPSSFNWKLRNRAIVTYARVLMKSYMNSRSITRKKFLASMMAFSFDHL